MHLPGVCACVWSDTPEWVGAAHSPAPCLDRGLEVKQRAAALRPTSRCQPHKHSSRQESQLRQRCWR